MEESVILTDEVVASGSVYTDESYVATSQNMYDNMSSVEFDQGRMYDWMADSGASSHITYRRDAFAKYQHIVGTPISVAGGLKTSAIGMGDLILRSECDGISFMLKLHNVLHIPSNKNNLFSLGRWESNECKAILADGNIHLILGDGRTLARGPKTRNNLYKLTFTHAPTNDPIDCSLNASTPVPTWEIWHRCFGHVAYGGLKTLHDHQLVEGMEIDVHSPKPDCVACTEAKHSETPYRPSLPRQTKPGELTHMDLWGKYQIASIHNNYYYLLMVDDATRHITIEFLKTKDQAAQKIVNYIATL